MAQTSISHVEISLFAHATENEEKVLGAVQNIIPSEYREKITFSRDRLKGEYGNPITFLKTQIRNEKIADALLRNISLNLTTLDKENLLQELDLRLQKGNLYIRLDKQAAFLGKIKLLSADPIHICIRFKTSKIEEIKEKCREIGLLP
ncbi:MAG: RNA-binding domain-containing protein [Candidatus Bathyarchaeia archaeon]